MGVGTNIKEENEMTSVYTIFAAGIVAAVLATPSLDPMIAV